MFDEDYRYVGNELKQVRFVKYTAWARWSDREKEILRHAYLNQSKSMKEIARILGRPIRSIESQLRRMGSVKIPNWSKEDEKYLLENHKRLSIEQLSVILRKSRNAVAIKKSRLCIK